MMTRRYVNHHKPIISLDLYELVRTVKSEQTSIEIGEDGRQPRRSTIRKGHQRDDLPIHHIKSSCVACRF